MARMVESPADLMWAHTVQVVHYCSSDSLITVRTAAVVCMYIGPFKGVGRLTWYGFWPNAYEGLKSERRR